MSQAAYQFPVVTIEEAVEFLNNEIPSRLIPGSVIKEVDFKQPDPQRWRLIYEGLYELVTSVPFDVVFQQHRLRIGEAVEYPELHEESAHLCLFALAMGRVLATCGISDFVVKDIVKPTTKRLLKIVSALLNFYNFQRGRLEVFSHLKEDVERRNLHFSQLKKENDAMRRAINDIKAAQAEKEPQILQLQNDIRDARAKMDEQYKLKGAMLKSISELKAGVAEKKSGNDQLRLQILEEKKAGEKLSRQIVHSPERLKEEKKRSQAQLAQLRTVKEDRRGRLLELHQQNEGLQRLQEEAEQALKLIRAIELDDKKEKECSAEVGRLQDQLQTNDEELQALSAREQELDRLMACKQEKISKLSVQHQYKMASARETLAQLKKELEWEQEKHSEQEVQKQQLYKQKNAINKELQSEIKAHQNRMDHMKAMYALSLEKLEAYHNKLATCWDQQQP